MMPRIGITTSFEDDEQRLHRTYVQAVESAGGLPLIVPMVDTQEALNAFVDMLDGLVITGGPAVTDGLIGDLPDDISETHPARTHLDRRVVQAFRSARKPVLGICYGMQFLNAEAGGTLHADAQALRDNMLVHSSSRGGTTHAIRIVPGSTLATVLGSTETDVNTRHIQAVAAPGEGFTVTATAPDGTIEAIEDADGLVIGVQFHPERMGASMRPLFEHLVRRARRDTEHRAPAPSVPT